MSPKRPDRARNARGQGARLREEILHAATRLVDAGTDPLTLRGLAREAGISAPSIYDHFSDVAQILGAVRTTCFSELDQAMLAARDPLGDPVARLDAVCHAYLVYAEENAERYRLMFSAQIAADSPDACAAEAFATLFASLGECVRALRSSSKEPYLDAVALWSGLHGLAGLRISTGGFPWPDQASLELRLVRQLAHVAG